MKGTLYFDVTIKGLKKLFEAENKLQSLGVTFDTGMELGTARDWELDDSLSGMSSLQVRNWVKKNYPTLFSKATWYPSSPKNAEAWKNFGRQSRRRWKNWEKRYGLL